MFKESKKEIKQIKDELAILEHDKKLTQEMLEEKRKQAEKKYLHPIIEREEECKSRLSLIQQSIIKGLCEELDAFAGKTSSKRSGDATVLLEEFEQVLQFDKSFVQDCIEKAQPLFEYFLEIEDVDSCVRFLKSRERKESDPYFDVERFAKDKAEYIEMVKDLPKPKYTTGSEYMMSFGKYWTDIIKFIQLCGKIDARSAKADSEGIYYSPKTKEAIISASLGEYGEMVKYLYADGKFGHKEKDREVLMYWHDDGYTAELEKLQGYKK